MQDSSLPITPDTLDTITLSVGRFQVPEDADDMLGLAHRMPGVVNVWLSGAILHLECQPGTVDASAVAERLKDQGYPIQTA